MFILSGYLTRMPTQLFERFHLSLAEAGFSAVVYHHLLGYVGLLATGVATDRLIGRFPRVRLIAMAVGLFMCAPFIALSAWANQLWIVYVALASFGLFRGVYGTNLFAAIFDVVEDRLRSSVTGLIVAAAYVFGALAPFALRSLKDHYGLEAGLSLLAGVACLLGTMFIILVGLANVPDHTQR